jgi:hypothetical protein
LNEAGERDVLRGPEDVDESLHRKASGSWFAASLQLVSMRLLAYSYYRTAMPVVGTFQLR